MQNTATDQNFSPGEGTSFISMLEASTVGKLERAGQAYLKLSEQGHFLRYAEAGNT